MRTWKTLVFERGCLQHVREIKRALGISGVRTEAFAWRSREAESESRGVQIDLVLDRADKTVDLCETKYSDGPFEIDKEE